VLVALVGLQLHQMTVISKISINIWNNLIANCLPGVPTVILSIF